MIPFPLYAASLSGITLVEASAGTGKTWTLCELYLRLLLRHLDVPEGEVLPPLDVREILVVTFTHAATAELRARLLRRIVDALHSLNTLESPNDDATQWLSTLLHKPDGEIDPVRLADARKRLELARLSFDEAAVSTIHGFCQRALTDVPFSGGLPFATALDEFRDGALEDEVRDFWRRESSAMSAEFAGYLLAQGDGPERYLDFVNQRLKRPLATLCFEPQHQPSELEPEVLLAAARDALLERLMTEVPARLRAHQRKARVFDFNSLLFNLHEALTGGDFPALAGRLRDRYPVALVDEFQDTDPLQFGILKAIYGEKSEPVAAQSTTGLMLVGDPKQAIYAFRNADLHTYLAAREPVADTGRAFVQRTYGLIHNQRATLAVIKGCNRLFAQNPAAFVQAGINFTDAAPGVANPRPMQDRSGAPRRAFQIWRVPPLLRRPVDPADKGSWRNRDDAQAYCAEHCAREIGRLLSEAEAHRLYASDGCERALAARDIAVLVRTHQQAREISEALQRQGIRAVAGGKDSVFQTPEADALARILQVLVEPQEGLLRAALATPLLGQHADSLDADDAALNGYRIRFANYRADWDQRGFAFVFRRLLREEAVAKRLLARPDAERRLTNLLHLGDLLTEAAAVQPSRDALLRWFAAQCRDSAPRADAYQLRLESDENLVRIQTVHTAKGLEFPIVLCPYAWDRLPTPKSGQQYRAYHAGTDAVLDFRRDKETSALADACVRLESAAESLRLIYVAVTRASQRCYVYDAIWSDRGNPFRKINTPLHWLLAGAGDTADQWFDKGPTDPQAVYEALCEDVADDVWGITDAPDLPEPNLGSDHAARVATARQPRRERRPGPGRMSYSSMARGGAGRDPGETDYDEDAVAPASGLMAPAGIGGEDFLRFPRGANAGICVHSLLENIDFTDPSGWQTAAGRALHNYPPEVRGAAETDWARALLSMLGEVLGMPLPGVGPLRAVPRGDRLVELSFTLPVHNLSAERLFQTLQAVGYPLERSSFNDVTGYLAGVIDLLFRHEGRYYLIDWKSNHRGDLADAYAPPGLRAEMTEHGYHLQLLLYTVAIHRFLRGRVPDYSYETHFGGAFYLFLRGMRQEWVSEATPLPGVYHEYPPFHVIDALDVLFRDESGT